MPRELKAGALRILVVDIGGTRVKFRSSGETAGNSFPSNSQLTPQFLCQQLQESVDLNSVDAITIGYPGVVCYGRIARDPNRLGSSWLGFDFNKHLGKNVKVINDTTMQAIGSYRGGRSLFLSLGTALGTCLVSNYKVIPVQAGILPFKDGEIFGDRLGGRAREYGPEIWLREVYDAVELLKEAFIAEEVVVGGGNAQHLQNYASIRLCTNDAAFDGGEKLWSNSNEFELL